MTEIFVDSSFKEIIKNNVIKSCFPLLSYDDTEFLLKLMTRLINIISVIIFNTSGKQNNEYYYQLKQNDFQDIKWLLVHLLPYIDTNVDKTKISKLEEIYTEKYNVADINKEEPLYKYSNFQYDRCVRDTQSTELKFSREFIEHNFYLLINSIKKMSNKLFVNWIDIIPYSIYTYTETKLFLYTKVQFNIYSIREWDAYTDVNLNLSDEVAIKNIDNISRGLDIEDIYNTISIDLYSNVKNIKWLIYDIPINNSEHPIQYLPAIFIISEFFNIDDYKFLSWNELTDSKQKKFIEKFNNFIEIIKNKVDIIIYKNSEKIKINNESLFILVKGFIGQFQKLYKYYNSMINNKNNKYIPLIFNGDVNATHNEDIDDINNTNHSEIIKSITTLEPLHAYEFIIDTINKLKQTWYSVFLMSPDKKKIRTLDSKDEYDYFSFYEIFYEQDKYDSNIQITLKNIYNWCKSLIHHNTNNKYKQLDSYWSMLDKQDKKIILDRLNTEENEKSFVRRGHWASINKKRLTDIKNKFKSNLKLEEINSIIYNKIRSKIPDIIMQSLIFKGVLTQYCANKNASDRKLIDNQKIHETLRKDIFKNDNIFMGSYHYLTKLPYIFMDDIVTEDRKVHNIFEYYSNYSSGYSVSALNWVAQIGFCHKFIHNRVSFITGSTGVGKSTQIPNLFLYYLSAINYKNSGKVVCTAPRIPPTKENASYVSSNLGVPIYTYSATNINDNKIYKTENYFIQIQTQDEKHIKNDNIPILKYVTDGSLILEISDHILKDKITANKDVLYKNNNIYDIIIIDEAHEHNLNIDLLLTLLKNKIIINNDVKLVILSATMNDDEHRYRRFYRDINDNRKYPLDLWIKEHKLDRINVDRRYHISPPGATTNFPITEIYLPNKNPLDVTLDIVNNNTEGDILVFQIGVVDIKKFIENINPLLPADVIAIPFHGTMSNKDFVQKISENKKYLHIDKSINFDSPLTDPTSGSNVYNRVVLVATNVAEASLTISTLKFVVDIGTQKNIIYDYKKKAGVVKTNFISESSRLQRKGRVGRTSSGTVYYLYKEGEMKNNKTFCNICMEDLTHNIFNYIKQINEKMFLEISGDPNSPKNNLNISKNILKIIKQQYFLNGKYYDYYGNNKHNDYKNYNSIDEYYESGYSKETIIDEYGTFYIIHPDELLFTRNICGKIIKTNSKNVELINNKLKSKKMESFFILLKEYDYFINDAKTILGNLVHKIMKKLELSHQHARMSIFSMLFNCEIDFTKLLGFLESIDYSSPVFDIKKIINQDIKPTTTLITNITTNKKSDLLIIYELLSKIEQLLKSKGFSTELSDSKYIKQVIDKSEGQYLNTVNYYQDLININTYNKYINRDDKKVYNEFIKELQNIVIYELKNNINVIGSLFDMYNLNSELAVKYISKWIKLKKEIYNFMMDTDISSSIEKLKNNYIDKNDINKKILYIMLYSYPYNICKKISGSKYYLSVSNPSINNMYEIPSFSKYKYIPKTLVSSTYLSDYLLYQNINVDINTIMLVSYINIEDIYSLNNVYNVNNVNEFNTNDISEYITKISSDKKNVYSAIQKINTTYNEIIKDIKNNPSNINYNLNNLIKKIDI